MTKPEAVAAYKIAFDEAAASQLDLDHAAAAITAATARHEAAIVTNGVKRATLSGAEAAVRTAFA